jgi:hypothetical protein
MYRMTINNQDGCSASDSTLVTVYTRPVPTINGLAEVCEGSTGIAYSTEAFMTDYHWFVDRGTIIDGDQTSTIIVNWGTEGTGAVFVTYITPNGCEPESPAEKTVEIHPAPVNNLELVNVTIQNGQAACAAAGNAITVAGNGTTYTVYAGGVSRMAAGLKIYMYSGTRVFPGGYLSAVISGECMFCNNLKNDLVNNGTSDPVIPDKDLPENGSDIRIWPNPAREFITVEWTSNAEVQEGEVIIYGLTGSQIARHSISANTPLQFDLTGTPPGLCLVRISSGGNEWVRKVVRQP